MSLDAGGRLPAAFLRADTSSFTEFLGGHAPDLLPTGRGASGTPVDAPHGTTVVALRYTEGVLVAGDRRATMGHLIASHTMTKVFVTDDHSAVGIAGTAGVAIEMVRLLRTELEHYEKIEGAPMSLTGKANRLAGMIRSNLGAAMQGLAVVPLFVGFDEQTEKGRIFTYDLTGGCYEEQDHHGVGSGSIFARGTLKKAWRPDLDRTAATRLALDALRDAADDDSATGGPDPARGILPTVAVCEAAGSQVLHDHTLRDLLAEGETR